MKASVFSSNSVSSEAADKSPLSVTGYQIKRNLCWTICSDSGMGKYDASSDNGKGPDGLIVCGM